MKNKQKIKIFSHAIKHHYFDFARELINLHSIKPKFTELEIGDDRCAEFMDKLYEIRKGPELNLYYIKNHDVKFIREKYKHLVPEYVDKNIEEYRFIICDRHEYFGFGRGEINFGFN